MPASVPSRRRVVQFASGVLAAAALALPAQAGERRIVIGEVSSKVVRSGVNYETFLRAASEEELQALDLSLVPRERRVIVSVALVKLDTLAEPRATDANREISCEVSATVRDAKGGTLFAILQGRARTKGGGPPASVENAVVHGALHGALARIPEVLRH